MFYVFLFGFVIWLSYSWSKNYQSDYEVRSAHEHQIVLYNYHQTERNHMVLSLFSLIASINNAMRLRSNAS